jgi:hypothetical protein
MTRPGLRAPVDSSDAPAESDRRACRGAGRMVTPLVRLARRLVAGGGACLVAVGALGAWPSPAAAGQPSSVERVLVISVPGLTWDEVRDHDLPALDGLLAEGALADMAPRGVSPRSTPGAAYLTLSAGTRATSDPLVDGHQLALDEQAGGSSAAEIYERRTGVEPDGSHVSLAWPTLERVNAGQPYDAELGLLTDALRDAGLGVAAVGNADGTDGRGTSYERQVGLAAVTGDGVIPAGALGSDLLVPDASRPFGQRLDVEEVASRVAEAWRAPATQGGAVIVEASDLARSLRYRDRVEEARYRALRAQALADTDALVDRLLEDVDLERDAVLVVAPYNLAGDRDLTVSALRAPGHGAGYLRSASTQRAGFLTLVDVAPTLLDLLGVDRPDEMEGRPAEVVASSDSLDARIDRLVASNEASRFRERLLLPTTLVVVVVLAVVCAAAMVVLARRGSARAARLVAIAALADLAVLPLSYLARGVPLEDLGIGFYWAFVSAGALVVAGLATLVATRTGRPWLALVCVLVAVAGVPLADVTTGSGLSLNAAFGYSPTGNSRLYGISNYSFGQVAAATCLLAALAAARWPTRRGRVAAVGLMMMVLVVVGAPMWGSDVGGIIAFTPTIVVFAALVTGYRVRLRTALIGLVVTAVVVAGFGLADLARPAGERAHLGRLFERIGDEGLEPLLSIMERKLLANLRVSSSSFWIAAIAIAVAFLVFLTRYPTRPLARMRERTPTLRAGVAAAVVVAVLGSAVNDSGAIVGGVTLMVLAASLAWLAIQVVAAPPAEAPREPVAETAATTRSSSPPGVERSHLPPAGVPPPARAGIDQG